MGKQIPEIKTFNLCQRVKSYFNSSLDEADMQQDIKGR